MKAEVIDTLLYGDVTWSPSKGEYDILRKDHHWMLLQCLGCPKRKREDHFLSYANVLLRTDSEGVEATGRRRRILFVGFVARIGEERVRRKVVFGEPVGGKGVSGGQERDWMNNLDEDQHQNRRVARGRAEGQQIALMGSGRGRGFQAEMKQGRERGGGFHAQMTPCQGGGNDEAMQDGCDCNSNR